MESVPPPPFRASKRVGKIMYDLWYGRITVERARELGAEWGMTEQSLATIIADATAPPSYWSRTEAAEPTDQGPDAAPTIDGPEPLDAQG